MWSNGVDRMCGKLAARFSLSVVGPTKAQPFELLKEQPGLRPAPYLASRGMKWIQHYAEPGLVDDELRDYIRQSHRIVSLGLPMKKQRELGLNEP